MTKYKVIFTYDGDEIVETKYEGYDETQAKLIYSQEKLNLLEMGGDDCCNIELITEEI